jgi:hypothetical protein
MSVPIGADGRSAVASERGVACDPSAPNMPYGPATL